MSSDDRVVPDRKRVKEALREAGLSTRQADSLLRGGWSALVGESKAEAEELREALARFQVALNPSGRGVV